jgi:Met-zincin/Domain of unknown function (DUF5117)/Domain of unknown function (DUF5118)
MATVAPFVSVVSFFRCTVIAVMSIWIAACATVSSVPEVAPVKPVVAPAPTSAATPAATNRAVTVTPSAAPSTSTSTPPNPSGLRPFADIIKDAKQQTGLFTLWTKDDKVWIEIQPEQFNQLYYLQSNLNRGVMGESAASMSRTMLQANLISFKKLNNSIQLIARNFAHRTPATSPLSAAIAEGSSDSLLASMPILSAPHPERKSVLIEANAFLIGDIPMLSASIDASLRAGYSLDRANSYFNESQALPQAITFDVTAHYAVSRLPIFTPSPGPVSGPQARAIRGVPDARSFFVGLLYTISKLPDTLMRPRAADGRIGHFNQTILDFSDGRNQPPQRYVINRWRLEKSDPSAALSEPKKPITYWLDKNIPTEFRAALTAGILEWNKAFEKIGFKNAIRVEQQPDNAKWSTYDVNRASVRWVVDPSDSAYAFGPSRIDPRTGEILSADISISNGWATLTNRLVKAQLPRPTISNHNHTHDSVDQDLCSYDHAALEEASFGMDLLALREGALMSPAETEKLGQAILKDVATHEVGHTLGLRHNFRASTIYSPAQISDPAFTRRNGLSGSVMDYNAFNIALDKEPQGDYVMSTLGPYDYWAIEYAYKEIPPAEEATALKSIAARSSEPTLAYATDEELQGDFDGMDPSVNQRDGAGEPLEFAKRRVQLSRELFERLQSRLLASGESYDTLNRNFSGGLSQLAQAFNMAAKYVGGVVYVRDQAGSSRAPFTPVSPALQRQALKLISDELFASNGFNLKADFVSRLSDNPLDRGNGPPIDRSPASAFLGLQTQVIDRLMSPRVADRLLNSRAKLQNPDQMLTLSEVYGALTKAIWNDGQGLASVNAARRALQREHLRRLTAAILRPGTGGAQGDARALHRLTAKNLLAKATAAKASDRMSLENQAYLDEIIDTLKAALNAQMARSSS